MLLGDGGAMVVATSWSSGARTFAPTTTCQDELTREDKDQSCAVVIN